MGVSEGITFCLNAVHTCRAANLAGSALLPAWLTTIPSAGWRKQKYPGTSRHLHMQMGGLECSSVYPYWHRHDSAFMVQHILSNHQLAEGKRNQDKGSEIKLQQSEQMLPVCWSTTAREGWGGEKCHKKELREESGGREGSPCQDRYQEIETDCFYSCVLL